MIRITKHLYIHVLLAPMLVISYFFGSMMTFFMSFGVVLIHELCHLLTAIVLDVRVKSIVILPFGMSLRLSQDVIKFPKKEILIALAGPLSNVIMIMVSGVFFNTFHHKLNFLLFVLINWSVLLTNLIPVPPLDGGRIMRAILIKHTGLMGAGRIIRKISRAFIMLILAFGIYILIITRGNPSLCIIGAFLAFSMIEEKNTSDLLLMHELICEKERFKNRTLIPTEPMTINYRTPAFKVIKKLNFSTFYIVYIVDDSLKIIKTATESDFIRAVRDKGYSVLAYEV